ncbi:MAG: type II toxin-antitoxin system VapC family toxin [Gemmatimonadales bacterium]|nr:type II toxin-antitoxin system VapC family toxin [Gemmatimonadales bacterium]MYC88688.1 type II toxin-antitoxin system VapC family toxin [Candidatus Palauibacter denitrificans]
MILLDTHVIVWHERGDSRLGRRARRTVERALLRRRAAVSAISFWEVAMQVRRGHLDFRFDAGAWHHDLLRKGLIEVPVNGRIGVRAELLENLPGDPADRLIVATALEGYRLVTADRRILEWPGRLNRIDATE